MKRLIRQAQNLENQFFFKESQLLLAHRQELARRETSRKALAEVSGIKSPDILDKLVELEITPDLLASLALLPLVQVAWADGRVQDKERDAILAAASAAGLAEGAVDRSILEQWLQRRPNAKLLEAWTHYVAGLCESLSPAECTALADNLLSRARAVAQSAGTFLGLSSGISAAEQAVLDRMQKAFSPQPPSGGQ